MKLKQIVLQNFRPYKDTTRINLEGFTAFIGKNDIGKSCILEALEIFFNENLIKLDHNDLTKGGASKTITIGCIFSDLPNEVILDKNAKTNLKNEFLLNKDGHLEIHKVYNCNNKTINYDVYANALHPTATGVDNLLNLKNADLKQKLSDLSISDSGVDKRSNPSLREAIWKNFENLDLKEKLIPLDEEDAKKIWSELEKQIPTFALFQSDRSSKDEDSEVQDPMKLAVQGALAEIKPLLEQVKDAVKVRANAVAERTLVKLQELDKNLASQLSPHFKAEPKWDQIFKMMLNGDDDIPINKRGSGVRRLVLLSFFRAEAERKQADGNQSKGLIYGIEEPETSQHPDYQRLIIQAFLDLSQTDSQVFITTHNPALAGLIPTESIRYVHKNNNVIEIQSGGDTLDKVMNDLGVLPDNRVRVIICVEGQNDVSFLKHLSRVCHSANPEIPDLDNNPRVAFVPLAGQNLIQWVDEQYLRGFKRPEIHFYDRDDETPPKYESTINSVNQRGDGSYGVLTGKREAENYLHSTAIKEALGLDITFSGTDDVPLLVAEQIHNLAPISNAWSTLTDEQIKGKVKRVKKRLNDEVASKMTYDLLCEVDTNRDIENLLKKIGEVIKEQQLANTKTPSVEVN